MYVGGKMKVINIYKCKECRVIFNDVIAINKHIKKYDHNCFEFLGQKEVKEVVEKWKIKLC